jgi:hypothetical protein
VRIVASEAVGAQRLTVFVEFLEGLGRVATGAQVGRSPEQKVR